MGQGVIGIGMLGRRQMTPRWVNDPVWMHTESTRESGYGRAQATPPPEGNQAEGGEGRSRLKIMEYLRKINDGAWVQRGHCLRMEHHHLMMWTHPMYRWPV